MGFVVAPNQKDNQCGFLKDMLLKNLSCLISIKMLVISWINLETMFQIMSQIFT